MAEPQKTKGVEKDDGGKPTKPTIEAESQAEELSTAGHLVRMIEQDRLNGLEEDHLPYEKAEGPQSPQVTEGHNNANPTYDQQIFDAADKGAAGKLDKLLSRGGVSPDCRDNQGRTPLNVACETGNAALAGVLIRHNADVNAVDADGETPLMKAAYRGDLELVELLISKAAALDMRNNEGLSALEIAQEMGHEAVVAFLAAQSHVSTSSIETEASTDSDDDSTADAFSEVPKSSDFEAQKEPGTRREYQEETAKGPIAGTEPHSEALEATGKAPTQILGTHDAVLEKKTETRPALPRSVLAAKEKRIEFDALDNKQVRNANEKIIKVFDKAGFEVGDFVIDTFDKGSYLAVLKSRSQENKRWLKLKKHPEWVIDPKRLTELRGGCAVRRLCLAEGIDISPFGISHFVELYYVRDLKLILTLAAEASANNYTVRQLKLAAGDLREHKDDHDPGKEIIKTLDQEVPILEDPDLMALCMDKDRVLEELSKAERKKIRALIKSRKPGLDEWKGLMDTLEGILSDLADD